MKCAQASTQFMYSVGSVNVSMVLKAAFKTANLCSGSGGQIPKFLPSARNKCPFEMPSVLEFASNLIISKAFVAINSDWKVFNMEINSGAL